MELTFLQLALLLAAAFFAGLVDAAVGGGGLIQLPALFALSPTSLPPVLLGTNKFAAVCGTLNAAYTFGRHVRLPWRFVCVVALCAGLASAGGAQFARLLDPHVFRTLLPFLLGIMLIYTLRRKDLGATGTNAPAGLQALWTGGIAGLAIGFYDGLIGPGTGTLLIFLFVRWFDFDFLHASASAKVVNVCTNVGAIVLFARTGNIAWAVGFPMAIANTLGAIVGSRLAIFRGNRFIRRLFIAVVTVLLMKTALDGVAQFVPSTRPSNPLPNLRAAPAFPERRPVTARGIPVPGLKP